MQGDEKLLPNLLNYALLFYEDKQMTVECNLGIKVINVISNAKFGFSPGSGFSDWSRIIFPNRRGEVPE